MEENDEEGMRNERRRGGLFGRFKRAAAKKKESRTVIKVRSVGDIPPILNARRLVSEGNLQEAIISGYKQAKIDYCAQFSVQLTTSETNRQFLIREFAANGIKIPQEGNLDNSVITERASMASEFPQGNKMRLFALRKLTTFYLDFYERARFQGPIKEDPNVVVDRLTDIYNYLDIMKLYYAQVNGEEEEVG